MSKGNEPAYPVVGPNRTPADGLTKREWFAGMAMQGIISKSGLSSNDRDLAVKAYLMADEMIDESNYSGEQ